jgi:hypothetical protein
MVFAYAQGRVSLDGALAWAAELGFSQQEPPRNPYKFVPHASFAERAGPCGQEGGMRQQDRSSNCAP